MERIPGGVTRRRALALLAGTGLPLLGAAGSRAERGRTPAVPAPPAVRRYYVSADPVTWNYTPEGHDLINGGPFTARQAVLTEPGPGRIGAVYEKSQYRRYTDPTFCTRLLRTPDEEYQGILGPVIRAQVGDTIEVVFRNNTPFPASMHPHGLFYTKVNEGTYRDDGLPGPDSVAAPGQVLTYTWQVPERAGPGSSDPSSVVWMYHDHSTAMGVPGTQSGLVGPIVVSRRGAAGWDGRPLDVDREMFALFTEFNESRSPYLDRNLARFAPGQQIDTTDPAFVRSNTKANINGYLFGNGPVGLTTDTRPAMQVRRGERVRWYVFALGGESDLHTPHWHGNSVQVAGQRTDVLSLLPASMVTADMRPDNPGVWLLHCHVDAHMMGGMSTRYQVR